MRVLILCTGNSCLADEYDREILAERVVGSCGFLNQYLLVLFEERGYRRETDAKSNLVTFSEIRVGIRCGFSCFFILRCSRGCV